MMAKYIFDRNYKQIHHVFFQIKCKDLMQSAQLIDHDVSK
jgi:hypothetical protein